MAQWEYCFLQLSYELDKKGQVLREKGQAKEVWAFFSPDSSTKEGVSKTVVYPGFPPPERIILFLTHLGRQGWELISVDKAEYHFKRQKA